MYGSVNLKLGSCHITDNVKKVVSYNEVLGMLNRHANGDWGDICEDCVKENNKAVKEGRAVLSVYFTDNGSEVWVTTNADRSWTLVLLPCDA